MPYIKKTRPPFDRMARLIKGYGFTGAQLADILEVSGPTARARLNDPQKLTLKDLDRINRFGHIPIEEIREAMER